MELKLLKNGKFTLALKIAGAAVAAGVIAGIFLPGRAEPAVSVSESVSETEVIETEAAETTASEASETTASETEITEEKTVTTSQPRYLHASSGNVQVENILQEPELPVGCEITALTILLNHYGFDADKCVMARDYLPKDTGRIGVIDGEIYRDSFYKCFIGDPFSSGFGCFSEPIVQAAEDYIADNGGGYTAVNLSGSEPRELYTYIARGIPVEVWATMYMVEPEYAYTWHDIDTGELIDWYYNEHAMVLSGYDRAAGTVTAADPLCGVVDYDMKLFEQRYEQMHSQAVIVLPDAQYEAIFGEEGSVYHE